MMLSESELIKIEQRRSELLRLNKTCPECNTNQVQLVDPTPPSYKCRECKHKWIGKDVV